MCMCVRMGMYVCEREYACMCMRVREYLCMHVNARKRAHAPAN